MIQRSLEGGAPRINFWTEKNWMDDHQRLRTVLNVAKLSLILLAKGTRYTTLYKRIPETVSIELGISLHLVPDQTNRKRE